jgi:2-polyprenyl-3-methyl-5-hydroxy-6-metoxy-1,4-benzoquinol methylase
MKFVNYTQYKQAEDIKRLKFVQNAVTDIQSDKADILEVGCGNGNMSYQLARLGHQVLAIDADISSILYARKNFSAPGLEYAVSTAEELESERQFRIVLCSEVLEHLYEPVPVLKTMVRMLRPDSILILTVPNGKGPRERLITKPILRMRRQNNLTWKIISLLKRVFGYTGKTIQSSSHSLDHVQFFSLNQINEMTKACGLEIITLKPANFIEKVFPFSLVTRFIFPLQQFDCWLADYLPVTWSSGFYMVLRRIRD